MKILNLIRDHDFIEAGSNPEALGKLLERLKEQRRFNYIGSGISIGIVLIVLLVLYLLVVKIFDWGEIIPMDISYTIITTFVPALIVFALVGFVKALATGSQIKLLLFLDSRENAGKRIENITE